MKSHINVKIKKDNENSDWNKIMKVASTVAGTVGSAVFLAKSVTSKKKRKTRFAKIANVMKIGSAAVGVMVGGVKLFNDYMPDKSHLIKKRAKKTYRRLKRKLAVI